MALIAEGVARTFKKFPPLDAYRYDLIGTSLGIVGFSLRQLPAPPAAGLGRSWPRRLHRPRAAEVPALHSSPAWPSCSSCSASSRSRPTTRGRPTTRSPRRRPKADNQLDRRQRRAASAAPDGHGSRPASAIYDVAQPAPLDDVLVIGAGGGNDVSVALAKGPSTSTQSRSTLGSTTSARRTIPITRTKTRG